VTVNYFKLPRKTLVATFVLLAAVAATRCSSGTTTILSPSENRCAMTLSPNTATDQMIHGSK